MTTKTWKIQDEKKNGYETIFFFQNDFFFQRIKIAQFWPFLGQKFFSIFVSQKSFLDQKIFCKKKILAQKWPKLGNLDSLKKKVLKKMVL